jgi:2-polyprenyl-3-methyl-5-hydroxy-6-metoxy-1,4-benzoquinol methylase
MNIQPDYQTKKRMDLKLKAIPLPNLKGKTVLDVGCDMRFWCDLATSLGASKVVGVDRGREVKGHGFINMADVQMDLGKQWHQIGKFDVVFLFSLYHHIYQNCGGDHNAIWFWLWNHLEPSGVLVWENPMDDSDVVVQRNVDKRYHQNYNEQEILESASRYFDVEYVGPALHEDTRHVLNLYPKSFSETYQATLRDGAGGASKAFQYSDSRRTKEIESALGISPYPGSLNLVLDASFDWDAGYYRSQILDVADRSKGMNSDWAPRWARFYPVSINNEQAYVFRFENEHYPLNFVELIAPNRLRDKVTDTATLWR